ncbi:MAG: UMP kinase [Patescibacteria group bacterium]
MNTQKEERTPKYERILLKLSGEALMGNEKFGIDPDFIFYLAEEIKEARNAGTDIVIVVGGGNIFRGVAGSKQGIERVTADYMGMLATVFNGLALQDALTRKDVETRLQTSFEMKAVAEPFIRKKAIRHLQKGRVVITSGGTGLPYVTTDTAAAIRALELKCQAIFKATGVGGVYEKDPKDDPEAKKYETLTLEQAFKNDDIKVMDKSAIELCRSNGVNIVVFDIYQKDNLKRAVLGEKLGTTIRA